MHSSRCVGIRGNVPTVILGRAAAQKRIPSGVHVNAGLPFGSCFALWVSCASPSIIELQIGYEPGETSVIALAATPTPVRIISPDKVVATFTTSTEIVYLWIEELDTMTPRFHTDGADSK